MNKIIRYLLLFFVITTLIMGYLFKVNAEKYRNEKAQKERWQNNYMETVKTNRVLTLTHNEFKKQSDARITRLLDSLKIRPKEVIRYVEVKVIQEETDTGLVPVEKIAQNTYKISDSGPCFNWQGIATILSEDSLNVKRTAFSYQNNIDMLYSKRVKGRFLFWRTYEKNRIDVHAVPKCGEAFTQTVELIK